MCQRSTSTGCRCFEGGGTRVPPPGSLMQTHSAFLFFPFFSPCVLPRGGLRCFRSRSLRLSLFDHKLEGGKKKSRGARRQSMPISSHWFFSPRVCWGRRVAQGQTTSAPTLPNRRRNGREAVDEPRQSTKGRLGVLSVFARCWVTLGGSAIKGQPSNVSRARLRRGKETREKKCHLS